MSQEPAVPRMDPSNTNRTTTIIILAFAAATVLAHWLAGNRYGFQRDELQTLDDVRHHAWATSLIRVDTVVRAALAHSVWHIAAGISLLRLAGIGSRAADLRAHGAANYRRI